MTKFTRAVILAFVFWGAANSATITMAQTPTQPQIAFTAFQNGQWDILSVTPDGGALRQLTNDAYEDCDPVFSPDGTMLAYSSRRNGNWDIYLLNLATGEQTRLTDHPHYDGSPAWNPTGDTLAFESYRSGDLDLWLINTTPNSIPRNLTATSSAGDFDPAWDDTGGTLFFSSWRSGDNDLWALNVAQNTLEQLTTESTSESQPVWDAQNQRLAYLRNKLGDRDIWIVDENRLAVPYSWVGSVTHPAFSPDGRSVAAVWQGANTYRLVRLDAENPVPVFLTDNILMRGKINWHGSAVLGGKAIAQLTPPDPSPLYNETLVPSTSSNGEPYDLVRLNDLRTGLPWLADTVDDSYQALRYRLRDEVGYDFLGDVSETLRPINFFSNASQYSSWHKSGRAIDTRFDVPGQRLEIVKEDIGGETYWRILLRCDDQSGRCGRPVSVRPWDYSGRARTVIAPHQGGIEKPNLYGYYVDFTQLAQMYGWERIASHDEEDFSWTWHFKAFEYWHFQKPFKNQNGRSNWYGAMLQVYPKSKVDSYFTWNKMRAAGDDPDLIMLKGIPAPPQAQRWWQQLVVDNQY